ncbi:MAG: hypothetical protein NTU44_13195, partial [Bacteroidetes bacterium]|nr:hypothetical protein [Bacteroidota bacterium]
MTGWGLYTRFYDIDSWNCEFTECGIDAVYLSTGGSYRFRHCTLGDYWAGSTRQTPALLVSNYYRDEANQITYTGDLSKAYFGNCIIYGNLEKELVFAKTTDNTKFNYYFENCLIRTTVTSDSLVNCIKNVDPLSADSQSDSDRLFW